MSYFPATHNLVVYAGDDFSLTGVYKEGAVAGAEVGVSLTGATLAASIASTAGSTAVTTLTVTADADQVTNPGKFLVALPSANADLLTNASYVYDVQCTWADGRKQTFIKGAISVTQDVTP